MNAPRRTTVLTNIALSMSPQLCVLFRKYSRNADAIQDLMQDVHERTFNVSIKDPKKAAAYIYQAANNVGIDWWRREQGAPVEFRSDSELPQVANLFCPERQAIGLQLIERVVAILPPRCQQALELVKGEGYTHKEAAVVMKVAEQTVQAHVRDALAIIRKAGIEADGLCNRADSLPALTELSSDDRLPEVDATELANACRGVIRAYRQRYANDRHDIDALVHETYRRLVAASTSSPTRLHSIPGFLLEAARDLALRRLRKLAVIPIDSVADTERLHTLGVDQEIEVIAKTNRNMAALTIALEKLPRRCREVFRLYKMNNCAKEEIAERLRITESEVTKQLADAVRRLEKALRKANEADGEAT